MAIFEDEPKKPASRHEIGQDLSLLSVSELAERIRLLREEITRLERERGIPAGTAKSATKSAAEALFNRR